MVSWLNLAVALAATGSHLVSAQSSTDCDPTKTKCPAEPALQGKLCTKFAGLPVENGIPGWTTVSGKVASSPEGAAFTVAKELDNPTIVTNEAIFGGHVDIWMRTAPGAGIVSSFTLLSKALDEIDGELVGGKPLEFQTNTFRKSKAANAVYLPVANTQTTEHKYSFDWTKEKIDWLVDDKVVRTLLATDVANFPQTPMKFRVGIWAGGDVKHNGPGTVQWAGGPTDFSKAPFTMTVSRVDIINYGGGKQYVYGDQSATWGSIVPVNDVATPARRR